MKIYLCSTVRNLLLALLKALEEPESQSRILMLTDQQKIDISNYDLSVLPSYVKIDFIKRREIKRYFDSRLTGKLVRLVAAFNVKPPYFLKKNIKSWFFQNLLKESAQMVPSQLFLFNDRNKIARLFRLAYDDYAVIEDGLSNYHGKDLKPLESLWRLISRHPLDKRYLGDDRRCLAIYLLKPESAPEAIRYKVRPLRPISHENVAGICYRFFRSQLIEKRPDWILATQPISAGNLTASGFDLLIYGKIISALRKSNISIALKIHPREDPNRYRKAFPETDLLETKLPLELMILESRKKYNIISIYSTAGMGFEQYCNRYTLLQKDEAEKFEKVIDLWRDNPEVIDERISALMKEKGSK